MSQKRSVWKNRPDGKTVKRNAVAQFYTSRPVELLNSPAFRVISRAAHLALARIEIELRQHAGNGNGKLIVTKEQFVKYGIHQDSIAPALRELEDLGILFIKHGRGGNAEHREPNRFFLNYLCGAIDAHEQITDAWKRFRTVDDAEQTARKARNAKDPNKVAYSRRNSCRKNRARKPCLVPDTKSMSEPSQLSGMETMSTAPDTETMPTIDISGDGEQSGPLSSEAQASQAGAVDDPPPSRICPEAATGNASMTV
jgi:hypothetical protein